MLPKIISHVLQSFMKFLKYNIMPVCCSFSGVAKHEAFKLVEQDKPNDTDVDESLQKLKDNDAKLKELNLNNIRVCIICFHFTTKEKCIIKHTAYESVVFCGM